MLIAMPIPSMSVQWQRWNSSSTKIDLTNQWLVFTPDDQSEERNLPIRPSLSFLLMWDWRVLKACDLWLFITASGNHMPVGLGFLKQLILTKYTEKTADRYASAAGPCLLQQIQTHQVVELSNKYQRSFTTLRSLISILWSSASELQF